VEARVAREERAASGRGPELEDAVQRLAADTARVVSEWHHYALLELVGLENFRPDVTWIARVLGLGTDEVVLAIDRLVRLGLLDMTSTERWTDLSGDVMAGVGVCLGSRAARHVHGRTPLAGGAGLGTPGGFAGAAVGRLFEQVGRLSVDTAERTAPERSGLSSTTLAVDSARLPEAFAALARFRAELAALLAGDGSPDHVYRLEIALFPLTRLGNDEETDHAPSRDAVPDRDPDPR